MKGKTLELQSLEDLLKSYGKERKPVRVTVSIDEDLIKELKPLAIGMSFSRIVELILRRAVERGAV